MIGHLETQRDAICQLARECARDAQIARPGSEVALVGDVDPTYLARLQALLGRPYSELEAAAFRRAFKLGLTAHEDGRGRDV